jgi:hypothetical protein
MLQYAKAIVGGLVFILTAAQQAINLTPTEHGEIAGILGILGTFLVWLTTNTPPAPPAEHAAP